MSPFAYNFIYPQFLIKRGGRGKYAARIVARISINQM